MLRRHESCGIICVVAGATSSSTEYGMKVSIILAHPEKQSFNHAIAKTAMACLRQNGHTSYFHDLYHENFNPVLPAHEIPKEAATGHDLIRHCREAASAEGIIIVHPNWRGQPPAIMKGWIDRVLRPEVAYKFLEGDTGEGVPVGLLRAGVAVVSNTSNTAQEREERVFGDPLELLWKNCIFDLCGVDVFYRRMFSVVVTSMPDQKRLWLQEVRNTVDIYFPPR